MATSGATSYTMTAGDIIKSAMEILNVLDGATEPDAVSAAMGLRHLNFLLKTMQMDGCDLWRQTEFTATVPASTATITLAPRVIDVLEARLVLSSTYERTMARWDWGDYVVLPNKAAQGDPTCFTLDKQRTAITLTVWPVPTAERTIKYTAARIIEDVTALTQNVDLPQEWTECVYYLLADRLAKPFGVMEAAPRLAADVKATAQGVYNSMRDSDRPASVFMERW